MSMSLTTRAGWRVRFGLSLLLGLPCLAHAQFAVVSQNVQVRSSSSGGPNETKNLTPDTVTTGVTLESRSNGYGAVSVAGYGSYTSVIAADRLSFSTASGASWSASTPGPDVSSSSANGAALATVVFDVLYRTDVMVDGVKPYQGARTSPSRTFLSLSCLNCTGVFLTHSIQDEEYYLTSLEPGRYELTLNALSAVVARQTTQSSSISTSYALRAVPEPATGALTALGLAGVAAVVRRRRSPTGRT